MSAASDGGASWWELFGPAFTTAVLLGALLPLLGVVLVLRRQVFLAAAVGQAANLAMALALRAGCAAVHDAGGGHAVVLLAGLGGGVTAAATALRALSTGGGVLEARSVWVFLGAGAAAMLVLADAPHGMQVVQRLFLSSVLGAGPSDVGIAAALLLAALAALWRLRRQLWLWAIDPVIAAAYGMVVRRWDLAVGAAAGVGIGFAIHATGLTFTFGLCVLPVLCARELAASLAQVVWLAPATGVAAAALGFALGDRLDLPPGQCAVVVLALVVAMARLANRRRGHTADAARR